MLAKLRYLGKQIGVGPRWLWLLWWGCLNGRYLWLERRRGRGSL